MTMCMTSQWALDLLDKHNRPGIYSGSGGRASVTAIKAQEEGILPLALPFDDTRLDW